MRKKRLKIPARRHLAIQVAVSLVVATGFLLVSQAQADSTGAWGTVAGGATTSAESPTHKVSGTLGQWAAGNAAAANIRLEAGFWSAGACDCRYHGDTDADGDIDIMDVIAIVNTAFRGLPNPAADALCPHVNRGDVNCDGVISVIDVVLEVAAAFRDDNRLCHPCMH